MRLPVRAILPFTIPIFMADVSFAGTNYLTDNVKQFVCTTEREVGFAYGLEGGLTHPNFNYVIERIDNSKWIMKSLDRKMEQLECSTQDIDQIDCNKRIAYSFFSFILTIDSMNQKQKINFSYYKHSGFPSVSSSSIEEGSCLTN